MSHEEIRAALAAATIGRLEVVPPAPSSTRPADCYDVRDVHHGGYVADSLTFPDAHLIANAPTWLAELLAEVDRLTRWKTEATEVLRGLQDLGKALGLPLGEQITGQSACVAAVALHDRTEAAEQAVHLVRGIADAWATQPNDYDEDTEQQIEDGRAILTALDGGDPT